MKFRKLDRILRVLALIGLFGGIADADAPIDFTQRILPLLRDRCYSCHDGRKQTAGLRLDVRSRALRGGESSAAGIVPGKPDQSEIYRRIAADDDSAMPPEGKPLTSEEQKLIREWIAQGAAWPDALANESDSRAHWAFKSPIRPELPPSMKSAWATTPVDAFILERLKETKLEPSPPADPVTLCRRLHLDLIGLPPSPAEVDAFVREYEAAPGGARGSGAPSPAYVRLVDRLLGSPHYGERWGRIWLDAARYADSDGFEKDKPRFVWFYRDWVVNAFNRDLPYDRFIIEQLAGDLLPGASQDQFVATGFLRNSMINEEGGIDPEQFRMEAMFDRMDAIGKSILGLTIQCAQCHEHKYDPMRQDEYYRMFAFLNNAHEANVAVYTPEEWRQRAQAEAEIKKIEAGLREAIPDWSARMRAWEKSVVAEKTNWRVVRPKVYDESTGGSRYLPQPDGSFLCLGYAPTKHRVHLESTVPSGNEPGGMASISAFRLELLNDPNLPRGGPGRSIEGTAALTEFEVEAATFEPGKDDPAAKVAGKNRRLKFKSASADVAMPETVIKPFYADKSDKRRVLGPIAFAIDGKEETAWGIDIDPARRNLPRKAVFILDEPIANPHGVALHFHLKQNHGGWNSDDNQNQNLGRFRISLTDDVDAAADPVPAEVRGILPIPWDQRSTAQIESVFQYWRTTVDEWKEANARIEELWKRFPQGTTQLTLMERSDPRSTHVLKRGDFLKPGETVEAGVPAFLHPFPPDLPKNRLGFARWLVDRRSPTTARAFVNRVWQAYFGAGLVETPEDLGTQSAPPSHPELLDWLAVEFAEPAWEFPAWLAESDDSNSTKTEAKSAVPWSIRRLHRLIVLSSAYRQSSKTSPERLAADPANRLCSRGARYRLDAEAVRDQAMAASGLLDRAIGGPSVFPPAPAFLFVPPASYGPKVWKESVGPERYRRSMYVFRFRSVPYPPLQNFDAPNGDFSCVRRSRSNTPLQALTTMNEPVFLECARALARRALREAPAQDRERCIHAFRLCTARRPTDPEVDALLAFLEEQKARFREKDANPRLLAGEPAPDRSGAGGSSDQTLAELAAWTALSRVLLNLDETICRE